MEYGPVEIVEKLWGQEEVWINESEYCYKILTLKPGFLSSRHYHRVKKETFIVWRGECNLMVQKRDKEQVFRLHQGEKVTINPGQPHCFWLEKDSMEPCIIYEISIHHSDEDVVRLDVSRPL